MEFYEQSFEPRPRRAPPSLFTAANASYQNEPAIPGASSEGQRLQTPNGSSTRQLLVSGNTASLANSNYDVGSALAVSAAQRAPRRWAMRLNAPAPNTTTASPCTSSSPSSYTCASVSASAGTNAYSDYTYPEEQREGTPSSLRIYTANTKGTCASLSSGGHLSPGQALWSGQSTGAAQGHAFDECRTKPASFPMPTARNTMLDKEPPRPNPSPAAGNLLAAPSMSLAANNNINSTCRPLFPIPLPTSTSIRPLPVVDSAANNTCTEKHFGTSGVDATGRAEQNTWGSFCSTKASMIQGATSRFGAGMLINKSLQQPSVKVAAHPHKNVDEPTATTSSHTPTASPPSPPQDTTNRAVARAAPRCLRKLGPKPTTLIIPSSLALSSGSPSASARAIVGGIGSTSKESHAPLTNPATSTPNRTREERDAIHKLVLLLWESYRYQRQHLYIKHSASATSLASAASSCYGSGGSTPIARLSSRLREGLGSLADSNLPSPPLFFNNNDHNRSANYIRSSDGHKHVSAYGNSVSGPPNSIRGGGAANYATTDLDAATRHTEPLLVPTVVAFNASSPSSASAEANNNNNIINLFSESAREGRNTASSALIRSADNNNNNSIRSVTGNNSAQTATEAMLAVRGRGGGGGEEREPSANEALPPLLLHSSPTSAHAAIIKNTGENEESQSEAEERGNETLSRVNSTSTAITATLRGNEIKNANNSNKNNANELYSNTTGRGALGSRVGQRNQPIHGGEDEIDSRMLSSNRGQYAESVYEPYHQLAEGRQPQTSTTTTTTTPNHLQTTIQLPLFESDEIEMPPSPPNTENEVDDDEEEEDLRDLSHCRHTSFSGGGAVISPALRASPNPLTSPLSTTNSRRTLFTANTNNNDEDNNHNNTHNSSTSIRGFGIGVGACERRGIDGALGNGVSNQQTRLLLAPANWMSSSQSQCRGKGLASNEEEEDSAPVSSTGSLLAPQPSSLSTQQFLFDQNVSIRERSESISPEIDFLNPLLPASAATDTALANMPISTAFVGNHASLKVNGNSNGVQRLSGMYTDPAFGGFGESNNNHESTPALRPSNPPISLIFTSMPSEQQQQMDNFGFSPQQLPTSPPPSLSSTTAPAAVNAARHKFDITISSRQPDIRVDQKASTSNISPSRNCVDLNTTLTAKCTTATTTDSSPSEHENTHTEKINENINYNNKGGGIGNSSAPQITRNFNNTPTTTTTVTATVSIPDIIIFSPSSDSATVPLKDKKQQNPEKLSSFDSLGSYHGSFYRMGGEEEEEGMESQRHRYSTQRTPLRERGDIPAGVGLARAPSIRVASVDSIDLEDHAIFHHSVEALNTQWKSMLKQIGDVWDRLDGDVETKYHKLKVRITGNLVWDRDSRLETIPRSVVTPPLDAIRQMNEEHERRISSLSKGQLFLEGSHSQPSSIPSSPFRRTAPPPSGGLGSADDVSAAHRAHSSLIKTNVTRVNNLSSPLSFES